MTPGKGDLEEQSREKMLKHLPNLETKTIQEVLLNGFKNHTHIIYIKIDEKVTNTKLKEFELQSRA